MSKKIDHLPKVKLGSEDVKPVVVDPPGFKIAGIAPQEWMEKAKASEFKDLSPLTLDKRQMKFLKDYCSELAKANNDPIFEFENWKSDEAPWNAIHRIAMLSEMDVRDKTNNPPKYRDIAKRLQKIRKDRSLTVKQFAESLYKPLGVEPLPTQEFNYTPKQIHALEYGTMKIDEKLAEVVFRVFGVSGEWLLWNRGTPHTKTDTLTLPRLLDIENTLQNTVDRQKKIIGEEFMKELAKDGHPLTFKDENGNDVMRGATNARIRFDLYHAEERIKSLEKQVELLTTLLNNYIGQVEALKSTSITEQGVIDILDAEFAPDPPDIERDPEGNPL